MQPPSDGVCCGGVRYDIKGCEVSRWTDPSPEDHQVIVVLKDLNFRDQYIDLGREMKRWFSVHVLVVKVCI